MAITKTVLAKDNRKAIVRVTATGSNENVTIDIDADLKLTNETITSSALKVAIQKIEYSCEAAKDITVVRNSVLVATVAPGAPKLCSFCAPLVERLLFALLRRDSNVTAFRPLPAALHVPLH